ncbi:hypothetical protein [Paenibacillus sp. JJ-223]|uniref:hypothetical protein n=1 Tax=Paenibacillus sp. JJ-223 TaxID=2905647 RepID=UPI001F28A134|nr:hypothetical protein [Paenibacillus sp. JJ-223]
MDQLVSISRSRKSQPNSQQQRFWSEMEAGKGDLAKKLDEGTGNDSAQIPRTGAEWDEYFRSKYGDKNVDWKTSSEYKLYGDKYIPYTPKIRPNAVITKPSLPKGGKPEGNYAKIPPKGDRGLERQNESADVLAEQGYRTIMLDELPNEMVLVEMAMVLILKKVQILL